MASSQGGSSPAVPRAVPTKGPLVSFLPAPPQLRSEALQKKAGSLQHKHCTSLPRVSTIWLLASVWHGQCRHLPLLSLSWTSTYDDVSTEHFRFLVIAVALARHK